MQGVGALELRPEPSPRFIPSPGLAPIAGPGAGLAAPVLTPAFPPGGVPFGPAAAVAGAFAVGLLIGDAINLALDRPTLFDWGLLNPPTPDIPAGDPLDPGVTVSSQGQIGTEGGWVSADAAWGTIRQTGEAGACEPGSQGSNQGGEIRVRAGGGQLQYRSEGPGACGAIGGAAVYVVETPPQNGKEAVLKSLNGLSSGSFRPPGSFSTVDFTVNFEPAGDPLPELPEPLWKPKPRPLPEPEPELEPDPSRDPDRQTPLAPPIQPPEPPPVPNAPPIAPPAPNPNPRPVPGPFPSPDPGVAPAPTPTPLPVPSPAPGPSPAPVPNPSNPIDNGGNLVPAPPSLPVITPPDARFPVPGGPDVTTPGPAPTLPGIAKEVGRIENKVDAILNGGRSNNPDWLFDLLRIIPFIEYLFELFSTEIEGTDYGVKEACKGEDYGDAGPPERVVFVPKTADPMEGILERLDALADLAQANFDLEVNTCKRRKKLEGEWVTVNFVSDEPSPQSNRPLRKLLRYRDNSGTGADGHSRHWADFTWSAGPVCVSFESPKWGNPQCWAASESEGKRVINFAASIAGVDTDKDGEWSTSFSRNPRYGQPGRMRVERIYGFPSVTKRDGASGMPYLEF